MQLIDEKILDQLQAEGVFDGETMISLSGAADKLRQAWDALRWNLLLALAITYLLMAALFESWLYPFVILFSVPLGAVGGVLGLWFLNFFVFQSLVHAVGAGHDGVAVRGDEEPVDPGRELVGQHVDDLARLAGGEREEPDSEGTENSEQRFHDLGIHDPTSWTSLARGL